jgi:carbamoylphosphate synthase large subunit
MPKRRDIHDKERPGALLPNLGGQRGLTCLSAICA